MRSVDPRWQRLTIPHQRPLSHSLIDCTLLIGTLSAPRLN
jgi:hypothetical protein